jgi:hypothetical protein
MSSPVFTSPRVSVLQRSLHVLRHLANLWLNSYMWVRVCPAWMDWLMNDTQGGCQRGRGRVAKLVATRVTEDG